MHGDAQHPAIAALPCLPQAAMGQQGLRQQMAAGPPPPCPDILGKLGRDMALPRHQCHCEQTAILLQQMNVEVRALQQDAQIAGRRLVVSQHQQPEYLIEQSLVAGQCLLGYLAPHRGKHRGWRPDLGIQPQQAKHQGLQRATGAPAHRFVQMQLLPAGSPLVKMGLEAQVKTTPRPLIAMLCGGKSDATMARQHDLEQRRWNGGGLVDQQQIAGYLFLHQLLGGIERYPV